MTARDNRRADARERRYRVTRTGRGGGPEASFAWIPGALLLGVASGAFSAVAVSLYLLLHANWRPFCGEDWGEERGRTFISYREAKKLIGCGGAALKRAFDELQKACLIELARPGSRPNAASGRAAGAAAVWYLASRDKGSRLPSVSLPHGMARPQGAVRWHCGRIRSDVEKLTPNAVKLLAFVVGQPHRDADGEVRDGKPFPLPQTRTGRLLGLSAGACNSAISELLKSGRLKRETVGAGSRPSTYTLGRAYLRHRKLSRADLAQDLARDQVQRENWNAEPHDERK